jgi:hypothetical protein
MLPHLHNRTNAAYSAKSAHPRPDTYQEAVSWNPFVGCGFACSYCESCCESYGKGWPRRYKWKTPKQNCTACREYKPHFHPERLSGIPAAPIVLVGGKCDLAFATFEQREAIMTSIRNWTHRHPRSCRTFYMQSKQPQCFQPHLRTLPGNTVLVTTLETNRDKGYRRLSKAPPPTERYRQFLDLEYPRKVVTVEPAMDFDTEVFASWIISIAPEMVSLDLNREENAKLPEPTPRKIAEFTKLVSAAGIPMVDMTWTNVPRNPNLMAYVGEDRELGRQLAASCPATLRVFPSFGPRRGSP